MSERKRYKYGKNWEPSFTWKPWKTCKLYLELSNQSKNFLVFQLKFFGNWSRGS